MINKMLLNFTPCYEQKAFSDFVQKQFVSDDGLAHLDEVGDIACPRLGEARKPTAGPHLVSGLEYLT